MSKATSRARAIERVRKLRALASSPNAHEADTAQKLAARIIAKYDIAEAEIAPVAERPPSPPTRAAEPPRWAERDDGWTTATSGATGAGYPTPSWEFRTVQDGNVSVSFAVPLGMHMPYGFRFRF